MSPSDALFFAVICRDKADASALRDDTKDEHFAYLESLERKVTFAGALFDSHERMNGSLMVVEARDLAEATLLVEGDPFVRRGVYASWEISRWTYSFGRPQA